MPSPRPVFFLLLTAMFAATIAQASSDEVKPPVVAQTARTGTAANIAPAVSQSDGSALEQAAMNLRLEEAMKKAQKPTLCYTMRSYKFKHDEAAKDQLQLSSESTCEASSSFSVKNATGSK